MRFSFTRILLVFRFTFRPKVPLGVRVPPFEYHCSSVARKQKGPPAAGESTNLCVCVCVGLGQAGPLRPAHGQHAAAEEGQGPPPGAGRPQRRGPADQRAGHARFGPAHLSARGRHGARLPPGRSGGAGLRAPGLLSSGGRIEQGYSRTDSVGPDIFSAASNDTQNNILENFY